jgi:hypothetical protein
MTRKDIPCRWFALMQPHGERSFSQVLADKAFATISVAGSNPVT